MSAYEVKGLEATLVDLYARVPRFNSSFARVPAQFEPTAEYGEALASTALPWAVFACLLVILLSPNFIIYALICCLFIFVLLFVALLLLLLNRFCCFHAHVGGCVQDQSVLVYHLIDLVQLYLAHWYFQPITKMN